MGVQGDILVVLSYTITMSGDYVRARKLCEEAKPALICFKDWGLALANCGLGDDSAAYKSLLDTLCDTVYGWYSLTFQLLCLPVMSILSTQSGDSQRAVELLGLFSTAPRELTAWADKWPLLARLRANLEAELGEKSYATAWAKGRAMSLEKVVADALEK
jgi:hypothetical protein